MAKKTLLTEGEFKKFMKLARLEPLAAEKLAEMYSAPAKADDDERDDIKAEGRPAKKAKPKKAMRKEELELDEDLAALFEEDDEMRAGDDMPEPEPEETAMEPVEDEPMDMPDMDDDMGGDETAELKARIESSLEDLMKGLDDLMGMAGAGDMMDVETDEEGDEGMEDIQGGDAEMDDVAPPAPGAMDDEELMETVARRVAQRLQRESKVDAKSDLIAERIMKRLKNL